MGAACGVSGTGEALRERGGGMMATVQDSGSPGWEERRMDRWKEGEGKKAGEVVEKNGEKK